MKTLFTIKGALLFIFALLTFTPASQAAVYTAVASGNFDDDATWGITAPGPMLFTDVVIVPYGITVSLTGDVTMSGTASILVNGTLNSTAAHAGLIMSGGNLAGSGNVTLDVLVLGSLSSLSFTGTITANELTSHGININHPATLIASEKLRLVAGDLHLSTGQLRLADSATLEMAGGTFSAIGSGNIILDSSYNVTYLVPASPAGIELSGAGLRDITLNTTGRVRLAHDLAITGLLKLEHGTLDLSGRNLTFNPSSNLSASGSGRIAANSSSNIVIATSTDLSGPLRFASGENTVGALMLFMGHNYNTASLGSDVIIANTFTLSSGKLLLGAFDVRVNNGATASGGSQASYVVTNGGGKLYQHIGSGATATYPVGTINNFSPMTITADPGSPSDVVSVSTSKEVYQYGLSGIEISQDEPMVNATWYLGGTTSLPINYTLEASWMDDMHTTSFTPQQAYISHYTQGAWDFQNPSAATLAGGMYSVSRTAIRSLSPFRVAGIEAASVANTPERKTLSIFPNPAQDQLNFTYDGVVSHIDIHNVAGAKVKTIENRGNGVFVGDLAPGIYILSIAGTKGQVTEKFTRQ